MRPCVAWLSGAAAIAGIAASVGIAPAQEPQLAPEGRGLLPPLTEMPATLQGTPPEHPFVSDPSGGFSRTIFETDDDPNFKIIIRDFSFPPDRQKHTVTLPSLTFLHLLSGPDEISIAKTRFSADLCG